MFANDKVGGPMWIGPIQDQAFAQRCLKSIDGQQGDYATWTRMHGMLTIASNVRLKCGDVFKTETRNSKTHSTLHVTRSLAFSVRPALQHLKPCKYRRKGRRIEH